MREIIIVTMHNPSAAIDLQGTDDPVSTDYILLTTSAWQLSLVKLSHEGV